MDAGVIRLVSLLIKIVHLTKLNLPPTPEQTQIRVKKRNFLILMPRNLSVVWSSQFTNLRKFGILNARVQISRTATKERK